MPHSDRIAFAGILLYVLVVYTAAGDWIAALGPLRPALLAAALCAVALGWRWIWDGIAPAVRRGALVALVIYTAFALVSPFWSIAPDLSRTEALDVLKLGLSYVVLVATVSTPRRLRIACAVLALAAVVPAQGALRNYLTGQHLVEGYRASWHFGIFGDPNHLSMSLVAVVPITVMLSIYSRSRLRALWLVAVALQMAAVVLTFSRGAFLGLSTALVLFALREPSKLKGLVLAALLGLAVIGAAPKHFWQRDQTILTYEEDASAMARVHAYTVALRMAEARPVTGIGGGAFLYGWAFYAPAEAGTHAYDAHNILLEVLAEYGLFAALAFAAWVLLSIVDAGGRAGEDEDIGPPARAVFAGMCGYLVGAMFAGYKASAELYLLAGLAGAAALLAQRRSRRAADAIEERA